MSARGIDDDDLEVLLFELLQALRGDHDGVHFRVTEVNTHGHVTEMLLVNMKVSKFIL